MSDLRLSSTCSPEHPTAPADRTIFSHHAARFQRYLFVISYGMPQGREDVRIVVAEGYRPEGRRDDNCKLLGLGRHSATLRHCIDITQVSPNPWTVLISRVVTEIKCRTVEQKKPIENPFGRMVPLTVLVQDHDATNMP